MTAALDSATTQDVSGGHVLARSSCSPFIVLSLGAGVQSSALALMAAAGDIGPMPQCAIFADTQAEPKGVYDWLDYLEKQLPFPVYRVTAGNLMEASLRVRTSEAGNKYTKHAVPAFIVDAAGQKGLLMRQCTLDFKITVIIREIAKLRKSAGKPHVTQWIGISLDEARRMKPSRVSYITNEWPLVANRITRRECLAWMEKHGFPTPPRSSCTFCPYHSDAEWRRLKTQDPEGFAQAVEYDERLRESLQGVIRGTPYLHASRVPLRNVDFDSDHGQPELWPQECEGMCGV